MFVSYFYPQQTKMTKENKMWRENKKTENAFVEFSYVVGTIGGPGNIGYFILTRTISNRHYYYIHSIGQKAS